MKHKNSPSGAEEINAQPTESTKKPEASHAAETNQHLPQTYSRAAKSPEMSGIPVATAAHLPPEAKETCTVSKPVPPQALIDELVSFFERQGQPHEQARILAVETATNLVTLSPGWNKGAIHAENIGEIVSAGFRQGLRRLTLTIEAEGNHDEWFGHLRVTVVDTETWQEWAEQRNRDPTLN